MIESCQTNPAINCSFYLFQYWNTTVEISLVGALIPLVLSAVIVYAFRKRLRWRRVGLFTVISMLIITATGSAVGAVSGNIGTPGWLFILYWLLIVVWYSRLKFAKDEVLLITAELYVIGTLGVFFDDVLRTLLGFVNVPIIGLRITPDIWGAAGPMDGIFLTGLFQAFIYISIAYLRIPRH